MQSKGPGFCVLYRWRVRAGQEDAFIEAWCRLSGLYLSEHASLGSRLHRGADGIWYSYAQWPSAEARENAFAGSPVDEDAEKKMQEAILESLPSLVLDSVADFMVLPSPRG